MDAKTDYEHLMLSNIPKPLLKTFKKKARKQFGDKKGSIREAALEAMRMFNEDTLEG